MRNGYPRTTAAMTMLAACLAYAGAAAAQMPGAEACKAESISGQKQVDFATAYGAAEKRAKAWKPDAVLVKVANTSLGPLDAEGRSANWSIHFYSPGSNQTDFVTVANGTITCWAGPMPPGRVPAVGPSFRKDVKAMLAEAAARGGAAQIAQGYAPEIQLGAGRKDQQAALWYVNYTHPQKGAGLSVIFDANSGRLIDAIK